MNYRKAMTECALFSTIFIILLLLSLYTPIGLVTLYLIPIPFVIFGYRYGGKMGLWLIIINTIISFFIGSIFGSFLAIFAGSVGIIMGGLYKKESALPSIVAGVIIAILNFILAIFISNLFLGINIADALKQVMLGSLNSVEEILISAGNQEQADLIQNVYGNFFNNIAQLLPFIIISYSLFIIGINHMLVGKITKRMGINIPKFIPFREWTFPKSIIFYYLITVIIIQIKSLLDIYAINLIVINLYPLLQLVLMIQGLSFVFYYTYNKKLGRGLRVISIISLFIPVVSQLIHILGMVDIGFNLRNKIKA